MKNVYLFSKLIWCRGINTLYITILQPKQTPQIPSPRDEAGAVYIKKALIFISRLRQLESESESESESKEN